MINDVNSLLPLPVTVPVNTLPPFIEFCCFNKTVESSKKLTLTVNELELTSNKSLVPVECVHELVKIESNTFFTDGVIHVITESLTMVHIVSLITSVE